MTADLASFLAERLDDAEANISYAGPARIAWLTYLTDDGQTGYATIAAGDDHGPWCVNGRELPEPASARVVWDPARERQDIAADRALLALHAEYWRLYRIFEETGQHGPISLGRAQGLSQVLKIRAARFADHPDYLPEWAPLPVPALRPEHSPATIPPVIPRMTRA